MTTLKIAELSVSMNGRNLLRDVSFSLRVGEWLCIIGPNGAGKSTLLKAMAGICKSTGQMNIDDNDLRRFNERERACWIAYVPQEPILPAGMRVFDYVLLGRTAHLNLLASESSKDLDVTEMVISELALTEFRDRDVATLSGGERQRVTIARALAQASPVILLDEPTTALDVGYQQEVLELIDRLRREQKIAVITTMHDLTISGLYPDRLMLLSHGQIVSDGPASDVLTVSNISEYYGAEVQILDNNGRPIVVPIRPVQK
jgi:iron complex transport system ATP-binding protein